MSWNTDNNKNIANFLFPFLLENIFIRKFIQQIIFNEGIFLCDPDIYRELIAYEFKRILKGVKD